MAPPQPVQMTGISLTQKAFAVNLADTAYIFDQLCSLYLTDIHIQLLNLPLSLSYKAADGSMLLYSINPSQSTVLQKVTMNGAPPPFSQYMTAAASSSHIALYSVDNSASRINLFDVGRKAWTGSTPLYTSSGYLPSPTSGSSPDGSSVSLGVIIGGAVGSVVLIAPVLFFVIRRRRGGYNPQSSPYNTHIDPNLIFAANNIQSPMTNLPVYQVQPIIGVNSDPYLQPYSYAPPTVVSTHASPTFLQAQAAQGYEGATEGSPLTAYEPVPKVRGSPQAAIFITNVSSESSQAVPRIPQMNS
ncbi:MAG: hypothetical protein JOS17DRAFT_772686 [Linnemannia elongata]|nr:MAG: hypothetical protein JOS17DRAFT_772686 [Linnemannia elongata]